MMIKMEYWKGDSLLTGPNCSLKVLNDKYNETMARITNYDDIIDLFCEMHEYKVIPYSHYIKTDFLIDVNTSIVRNIWHDEHFEEQNVINYIFYDYDVLSCIRTRPGMYIGGTDRIGVFNLAVSLIEELALNCADNSIEVIIKNRNSLCISGNSNILDNICIDQELYALKSACALSASFKWKDCFTAFTAEKGELKKALKEHLDSAKSGEFEAKVKKHILPRGFMLEMILDPAIFSDCFFDYFEILYRIKEFAQLNNNVSITLRENKNSIKLHFENGLYAFFSEPQNEIYFFWDCPIGIDIDESGIQGKLLLMLSDFDAKIQLSYINNERALDHGVHIAALSAAIKKVLEKYPEPPDYCTDKRIDILKNMNYVFSLKIKDPHWDGATKRKIVNPELKKAVYDAVYYALLKREDLSKLFRRFIG